MPPRVSFAPVRRDLDAPEPAPSLRCVAPDLTVALRRLFPSPNKFSIASSDWLVSFARPFRRCCKWFHDISPGVPDKPLCNHDKLESISPIGYVLHQLDDRHNRCPRHFPHFRQFRSNRPDTVERRQPNRCENKNFPNLYINSVWCRVEWTYIFLLLSLFTSLLFM